MMRKYSVLSLIVGSFVAFGCKGMDQGKGTGSTTAASSGPKVKLEMYVMSKCPFGVQVEQKIKPVLDQIGDRVDFHLDFIADEKDGQFTALHGEPEVKGNIIQLCARKHYPELSKWMAFIDCQNGDPNGREWMKIPEGWEACATKNGMDTAKMKTCYEGEEGKTLLRESLARAKAANANGSPTIVLAGQAYQGGRSDRDFMRAICEKIEGTKPEPCSKIPPPVEVNALVLTDKRCTKCDTTGLMNNLRSRFFPKLTVKTLDYSEEAGKKLYQELGGEKLPVILFEAGVEKSEGFEQLQRWLTAKNQYKQLRYPASFDPTAEICDNKTDDTGDGKVDCDDATCTESIVCRQEKKNSVDVFVMSQCPFGVRAVDAMKEVLDNFKGKVDFDIHFIADKTPTGFNALHGQPEVDENIRQLCAKKYYKKNNKYLDYIWCRNKDYRSDSWQGCAKDGIAANVIEKCSKSEEGAKLLEEDIKIAKALEISGSPTWLANNRHKFSGLAPEQIKQSICQHNQGLANCDKKLTGEAPPNAAGAAPAGGSCN